jgi:hypothetical protein
MRRGLWIGNALGLLGALLLASSASATAIVEVIWEETGAAEAGALNGLPLTAQIFVTADAAGISSYGISLRFDDDIVLAATPPEEQLPTGFQFNLSAGVGGTNADTVLTFEAATFGNGPVNERFLIGVVHFIANDVKDDGIDAIAGLFNTGIDDVFDNAGASAGVEFIGAQVVPEPGTLLLLAAGLSGLVAGRRRNA